MVLFLGKDLVGVRVAFLPNYSLVLSLLKHRGVWTFLNLKIRNPNKRSPLNNSIDNSISSFYLFTSIMPVHGLIKKKLYINFKKYFFDNIIKSNKK